MKDRDMYYGNYGYSGFVPMQGANMIPNQMPEMIPNQMLNNSNYGTNQFNDLVERVARLERQVKRLEQRITRLETPYTNNTLYNNEPDNNMYMM